MSHELYREDGESFRSVRVGIRNDQLRVHTQDMGPATEAIWGDSDYEFWTTVEREHWGALAVALIREFLADDPKATDRLRAICKEHEVAHDWGSWI